MNDRFIFVYILLRFSFYGASVAQLSERRPPTTEVMHEFVPCIICNICMHMGRVRRHSPKVVVSSHRETG